MILSMRLGQHFLTNINQLRKIIETLDLESGDLVIEIGPGHGELTRLLAEKSQIPNFKFQIVAIEKDEELARALARAVIDKNIKVIHGDALKVLPKLLASYKLQAMSYKLVGNIPYYITGYLFRLISELENKPSLIVFTIQKEVAKRVCAKPPKMNLLASSVQFWAEPEVIGFISKKSFQPPPRVDSAILKLTPQKDAMIYDSAARAGYYRLIKLLFKQPRKTILNNLLLGIKKQESEVDFKSELLKKFKVAGIKPDWRPQNLSFEQISSLAKMSND